MTEPYPPNQNAANVPVPNAPKPNNRWVWILIIIVIVLAAAGVVFASLAAHLVATHLTRMTPSSSQGLEGGGSSSEETTPFSDNIPNVGAELTFDEICKATGIAAGVTTGPEFGAGVYRVGQDGIPAGLYYLGGSQTKEGAYLVFTPVENQADHYKLDDSVIYFGNYFTDLADGDVIVFEPDGNETMHAQSNDPIDVSAPYQSGVYRVGIDIPAGAYTITAERQSLDAATAESAAYVMKDLSFNNDSIVSTAYVRIGGRQTITVSDGQYLELYAAEATPGGEAQTPSNGSQSQNGQGAQNGNGAGSSYHHPEEHHTT